MMPSNLGYSLREAGSHIRRNWSTCLGAVITIFLSLFVIGVFALGSNLVSNLVGNVEDRVMIQAFLSDDADQAAIEAYRAKVEAWEDVESATFKKPALLAPATRLPFQSNSSAAVFTLL